MTKQNRDADISGAPWRPMVIPRWMVEGLKAVVTALAVYIAVHGVEANSGLKSDMIQVKAQVADMQRDLETIKGVLLSPKVMP